MLNKEEIADKIKSLRQLKSLSQDSFGKLLGVSRSAISQIEKAQMSPSLELLDKIQENFEVTVDEILYGKKIQKEYTNTYQFPDSVRETTTVEYVSKKDDSKLIPITSIKAAAGSGLINSSDLTTDDFIHVPDNFLKSGNHICIQIRGESMSPTFLDCDYAIIRHVEPSEWRFIPDQYVYVIADKEGGTYFKRVKNRFTEHGFITCMSDNVDKGNYPNFNLNEDEILSIWIFEMKFSFKAPNINDNYYQKVSRLEDSIEMLTREFNSFKNKLK